MMSRKKKQTQQSQAAISIDAKEEQGFSCARIANAEYVPQLSDQHYQDAGESLAAKIANSLGIPREILIVNANPKKIDPPVNAGEPRPREFEARPCSACQSYRPHGKSYSRVYCTRGAIRYCKCHYCGHTWSQESK